MTHIAPPANPNECLSCGVPLNADGTVDALNSESDSHFVDCIAQFVVRGVHADGSRVEWTNHHRHYGPARDERAQRQAMAGKRIAWTIETIIP